MLLGRNKIDRNFTYNFRGSVTVEAAIFLPVLLVAIITISFIMKIYLVEEYLQHILSDEIGIIAEEAYLENKVFSNEAMQKLEINGFGSLHSKDVLYKAIQQRVPEEQLKHLHIGVGPKVISYRYLFDGRYESADHYSYINADDLIEVILLSEIDIPFPIGIIDEITLVQRVVARGWTGTEKERWPLDFDEMSQTHQNKTVFVFPRTGERYHIEKCRWITNYPVERILTDIIRDKYSPCSLCRAQMLGNGANVYIFERAGQVFHSKDCPLVTKYVVSMDIKEAEKEGYTPCKICSP